MSELFARNVQSRAVTITVRSISGDAASIAYDTLAGNQPNTNGNYIAILNARDGSIPWGLLPDDAHVSNIFGDLPGGDLVMVGLDLPEDSYVVAYSLAPKATKTEENNFCASVFVPSLAPGAVFSAKTMSLEVLGISSYSAIVRYTALYGYTPKSHDNWIGIWDSRDNMQVDPPIRAVPVEINTNHGEVALNGTKIVQGHSYVVAYFTGGYDAKNETRSSRKQMACVTTFDADAR